MRRITLDGLLKIELPSHTVLLCGGGSVEYAGDRYKSKDSLFGMVMSGDELAHGVGDILPGATLTFAPPPNVAASDLNNPAYQGSRVRGWIAEIDPDLGTVIGTPTLEVDGIIDVPALRFPKEGRVLEVGWVSVWQRLFSINEGNLLNGASHKRTHPGELGLDNTTGVSRSVPWGTNSVRTRS